MPPSPRPSIPPRLTSVPSALVAFVALAALTSSPASAQSVSNPPNWRAQPLYGTVELSSGFSPDPHTTSIRAGGGTENPVSGSECAGYINADAPDVDLNYESGSYPLTIDATSETDVTLLVYTPDRQWVCNDDGGDGTDARISFDDPRSGNYNVWVGTYSSSAGNPDATVSFTELNSSSGSTSSARSSDALDWRAAPTFGTVELSAGFVPDPDITTVRAGGRIPNPVDGSSCAGMVEPSAPDVDLNYEAGSSSLFIYTQSSVDVTLVVYTPDREWICDDDGGEGFDAMIGFDDPPSGNYNIWVGVYDEDDNYTETDLLISEIEP